MKEYCAKCHSEVDETEFSQNQAESFNHSNKESTIPEVMCLECLNSK